MLGAVIRNGNNTLVVDLPTGMMELQAKLNSIGIQQTSDKIKLSDEDGNPIRVKLYATTAEEAHLLPLLAPSRTLADANSSVEMLHRANRSFQMRLKCSLLANGYRTLDEFFNDAKRIFSQQTPEDVKADALRRFEADPNIRAVVSCLHNGEVEVFTLPMSDRELAAANLKLEEYGADSDLKIEALRYANPWPNIFGDILDNEGLEAVNSLAAAFPYMENAEKLAAVVDYADVHDSESIIRLADHIDDFEFYPGAIDWEDVAREWISDQPYLQLSTELEDYFDYDGYGSDLQDEHHGEFVNGGYVFMTNGIELDDVLGRQEDMDFL